MRGRIEFDHAGRRPHGVSEKWSLNLLQVSGMVGRKGSLKKTVGYRELLTHLKMRVNARRHCFRRFLIGSVVLTREMVRCAVLLKIIALL